MTKVTVVIEGEIDEVIATLRSMAGHVSSDETDMGITNSMDTLPEIPQPAEEGLSIESPTNADIRTPGSSWNASYVHTFWRNLSDTARQAMIRVSRSPSYTQKRAQLMHTLQLSQRELSGSLSSQGRSLNRLKRRRGDVNLPRPLTYDKVNDAYVLDAEFAHALEEIGFS